MSEQDFDEWVRARGAAMLRFAYLVTRDHGRAEEAVQDALVAAFPRWRRIRRTGDPDAYVRRCIINADISRWRRFLRGERPIAEPPDTPTEDPAAEHAEKAAVWALCAELPRKQRAAVVLRYYEGMSDAEIAEILDCTAGTVRSQIHRALAALRTKLNVAEEVGGR
jgi:RNA polymerase sigma-70 factor (sigma-E family)